MSKEWIAELWSNCAQCEDLIEPGDRAGRLPTVHDGATLCTDCLDEWAAVEWDEP